MQRAFPLPHKSPSEHLSYEYWRIKWNKLTAREQTYYKKKRTARKKTAFPSIGDSQAAIILTKHRRLNRTGRMGFWSFNYFFTKIMIFVFYHQKGNYFIQILRFYSFSIIPLHLPRRALVLRPPSPLSPSHRRKSKIESRYKTGLYGENDPTKKHRDIKCRPIWQTPPVQKEK